MSGAGRLERVFYLLLAVEVVLVALYFTTLGLVLGNVVLGVFGLMVFALVASLRGSR